MSVRTTACIIAMLVWVNGSVPAPSARFPVPQVDHHQHLLSPALASTLFSLPAMIELPSERSRFGIYVPLGSLGRINRALVDKSWKKLGPPPPGLGEY